MSGRPRRGGTGVRGAAADPVRARLEAGRRARARVRRYCASNGLNRLGTLTYRGAGCHDPAVLVGDVGVFFRRLRASLGGGALPYVWVPEWHKSGHGLHVHFALGRFVRRSLIEAAWGHGFVHIKLLGDLPVGSGRWDEARLAARYLSKYVTKTFTDTDSSDGSDSSDADGSAQRALGRHRYELGQGFQPVARRLTDTSAQGLLGQACELMGAAPRLSWTSDLVEDWAGPPALWVAW